jgi:pseudouridine synthase
VKERVQKLMAQANIGSRRANEELIRQGRVRVNGKVIKLGDQADPATDVIEVDGAKLNFATQPKIYIAFNKPLNVLTTNVRRRDDDRRTVRDFIPVEGHLFTIGRLDAESEGLIVLTNDGEVTNKLTHPRYGHTKTYRATVYGLPSEETIAKWESGVYLEEGKTAPCSVCIVQGGHDLTTLEIIMTEGKKRQVRRVASMLGHPVKRLVRTHVGRLGLGGLRPGEWRELDSKEVALMQTPSIQFSETKPRRVRLQRPEPSSAPARHSRSGTVRRGSPKTSTTGRDKRGTSTRGNRRPAQRGARRRRSE